MKRLYTSFFLFIVLNLFSQNQLYNNGCIISVNGRVSSLIPTLRVNFSITNNDGDFSNNTGLIELTGDWNNISSSNYYTSTGIERFTGTNAQTVSGTWNGNSANRNQFYDLKINKSSTTGEIVSLATNVNVNASGSVDFESSNGIIRTDIASHGNNGSSYPYVLTLLSVDASKFTNYSTGYGALTKYIEGKLKRYVDQTSTYYYPIGVASASLDGMEAFRIVFNPPSVPTIFPSTGLIGYIQPAAIPLPVSDLIPNGDILFYDIGSFLTPNNNFSQCVGGPDGIDDEATIDIAITHEWIATPDAGSTFDYNIDVYPGVVLDNIPYSVMGAPCDAIYQKAKYLARNGRIGGNGSVGPTTDPAWPGVTGLYQAPTGNTISNQNSFSRFRLFGATDNNTVLPVELIYLQANPVNNEYIKVSWTTASENNNKGFVLLRSTDGITFDSIAWIPGNGTTAYPHSYYYNDLNVEKGVVYYYRLKQTDFNGRYTLSRMVYAQLILSNAESILLYPNPSNTNTTVQLLSPIDKEYKIDTYNPLGQLMFTSKVLTKQNIASRIELPSNIWARGLYIVKVQSEDRKDTKGIRFIKE
ncbi:MAG: hypothetical protein JWN78_3358 [Bacteroidota bacterium]|nr:hypothetical protein [Bacteroidota bacterium]